MKKVKADKVFNKVAAQNGVDMLTVRQEIEKAIKIGMSNPDPEIQAQWKVISPNGEPPSPEALLAYLTEQARHPKKKSC